jgi:hypothetical protein
MVITAFAFEARNTDELSFRPGEKLVLLQSPDGGWWKGRGGGGDEGWFPSNHARELVTPPSASMLPMMKTGPGSPTPLQQQKVGRSQSFSSVRSNEAAEGIAPEEGKLSRSASSRANQGNLTTSRKSKSEQDLTTSGAPSKAVKLWTVVDVGDWLASIGLTAYRPVFAENEIAGEHLLDLDKGDLKELGVTTLGHRMTIVKGLAVLRAAPVIDDADDSGEDSDTYHC